MVVPEYYYAKPRSEHIALSPEQADKQAGAWSFTPNNVFEWTTVTISLAAIAATNVRFGGRPYPALKGAWKYLLGYAGSLSLARWADKANQKSFSYQDKVIEDYVALHPDRFVDYVPKTMKETFAPWYPIRTGSSTPLSKLSAIGKKQDPEHFVPKAHDTPTADN